MGYQFENEGVKQLASGSHRMASVEETLSRIEPLLPQFEITRVANVTGLDSIGIPVTLAIRPNSKSVAVSQGKGVTHGHAKASAIMESIEIWHAENFDKSVIYGSENTLRKSNPIIDTARLPEVPGAEFTDHTPMLWTRSVELFSGEEMLVPYEMVHADYTRPVQPMHGFFPSSTNGLASGNSLLEAVCHAIAEVVERDALSLWHFQSDAYKSAKRVDVASIENEECQLLIKKITKAGLECGIWDLTTDTGLACIMCIIRENKNTLSHLGLGSGCHVDSAVALRRALTEAAQTRLNYISGARDDLGMDEFHSDGIKAKYAFSDALFEGDGNQLKFADVTSKTHKTLREDLDHMLGCLKSVGIDEACFVDLSQDAYKIPVARVIIPGLEAPHDDDAYIAGPRANKVRTA